IDQPPVGLVEFVPGPLVLPVVQPRDQALAGLLVGGCEHLVALLVILLVGHRLPLTIPGQGCLSRTFGRTAGWGNFLRGAGYLRNTKDRGSHLHPSPARHRLCCCLLLSPFRITPP